MAKDAKDAKPKSIAKPTAAAVSAAAAASSDGDDPLSGRAADCSVGPVPAPTPLDEELQIDIPDEFQCVITKELFRHPVITSDGHTYEHSAVSACYTWPPICAKLVTTSPWAL
eukprot:COSAG05_NODE_7556_length_797_cov_0.988539_2_plen_113_part_00